MRCERANRVVCLLGAVTLACAGAEGPADEMEAAWIAQDGPIPANMTHAAWRAEKLARRAERLKPVAAMSKTWVYCRHYVLGHRSTFLHLSELSDAFEQRSYRAIGSSLCRAEYQPDGLWKETTLLSSEKGCYRDVDVSPDGRRLLFSFKASDRGDDFHLYAMDLATREVRQLTFGLGAADIEGCFLPDGRILFNSTRCGQIVDCWWNEVFNLYRCEADGSKITRITYDQVNDYFPTLADDGRVLYMRWEYNDRGQIYTQPVFSMNPDGTYQRALYGGNSYFPNCILQARMVPGSPLFFALGTGHHAWEPGELMRFDPREGREETAGCWELAPLRRARFVKRDFNFGQQGAIYCFPYPINEASVVVTHLRRTKGVSPDRDFGLVWTDVNGAREVLVAQDGKISCGRPVPVRVRNLPARSSVRPDESLKTGTITIADVYRGESMKGVARGTVKGAVGASVTFNGGTLATYEGMRRCVPFIEPTIATRVQSGGARIEVGIDAWAELPGVLAEDPSSRGGGLTKAGYGTLVLLGTNTYTGATRVEGGCLLVKDAGAVSRSASIHVAGEASLGFFGENLAAASAALAGKITWAPGSALLIDTRNGPVRISGRDLLGAPVVEKAGPHDLVFTSPPVGVGEIRVRQGTLRTSEPDLIPPAVKVLSLGGSFKSGSL